MTIETRPRTRTIPPLTREESKEHARILREYIDAEEEYTALIPRVVARSAGHEAEAERMAAGYRERLEEADRLRRLAQAKLQRFRTEHGLGE